MHVACFGKQVHHQCQKSCITETEVAHHLFWKLENGTSSMFRTLYHNLQKSCATFVECLVQTACSQVWSGSNCIGVRRVISLLHLRQTKHAMLQTKINIVHGQTRQLFRARTPKFTKSVSFPSASRVTRFRLPVSGPVIKTLEPLFCTS